MKATPLTQWLFSYFRKRFKKRMKSVKYLDMVQAEFNNPPGKWEFIYN